MTHPREKQLFDALAAAHAKRKAAGEKFTEAEWLAVAKPFCRAAPRKKSTSKMTDEEWLADLEQDPALTGVDVRQELGVAQFWLKGHPGRKFTRAFFRNWLIRAVARGEVKVNGAGQSSRKRLILDVYVEPENWRPVFAKLFPGLPPDVLARDWFAHGTDTRKKILEAML